jgi:hypothetical protein
VPCLASNVVRVSGFSILCCPFGSPWRLLIATGILAASQMNGKFFISSEFHLSNINFGLQLVEEKFEAANVVMRSGKSNSQCHRQKKKTNKYKQ